MKKLNLKRYLLAHLLILGLFILVELNIPKGSEGTLILGYVLISGLFSYDIINAGK